MREFRKNYHYWLDIIIFCLFSEFYLKKGLFQEIYLRSPGHGRSLKLFAAYPTNESWWKRKIGISCSQLFQIMNYLPITTNFKHFYFFLFSDGLLGSLFAFYCKKIQKQHASTSYPILRKFAAMINLILLTFWRLRTTEKDD